MKKIFLFVLLIVAVAAAATTYTYWDEIQGLRPALLDPPADISQLLGENNTTFPLRVPNGFRISLFADSLESPRDMMIGPSGDLLVSIPSQGRVVALPDRNGDRKADKIVTVADNLNRPHGLEQRCLDDVCSLYIAESHQVATYDFDTTSLVATNKDIIVDLPDGGRHFTRSLLFRPAPHEDELLISVGSSCDTCLEDDWRRAKILVADHDGRNLQNFGYGLRNSPFMAIHPVTGDVWATEMGRDFLGDDLPPDEINIIHEGKNYGWPICYGKNVHDTVFDKSTYIRNPCSEPFEVGSYIDLPAHSAPLGLSFFPEEGWPEEYWYDLLVAYHGSWNSTTPVGYKVVRYMLDENGAYEGEEDFLSGWLTDDGKALGRPVDVLILSGGTMYISDDKAGVIYLVQYGVGGDEDIMKMPSQDLEALRNLIRITHPLPDTNITSPLQISGEARGFWFFEADFPVRLLDSRMQEMGVAIAHADGEWMTEDFVPFTAELNFDASLDTNGYLVFEKDNPSGLEENDNALSIPVSF